MMGRFAGQNRLRAAIRALSESEADNRVCQRNAGRIACITSTTKGGKTMATRTGAAVWEGTLKQGKGTMKLGSGAFEGPYSFSSRFEEAKGTNPEELIGAAEAGCYSMALSANLEKAGHPAKRISTTRAISGPPALANSSAQRAKNFSNPDGVVLISMRDGWSPTFLNV